jgi:hypothetical protein
LLRKCLPNGYLMNGQHHRQCLSTRSVNTSMPLPEV